MGALVSRRVFIALRYGVYLPLLQKRKWFPLLDKVKLNSVASFKAISSKSPSCRTLAQLPLSQDLAVLSVCDVVSGFHSSLCPDLTSLCPLHIPLLLQWPFCAQICLNLCPLLPLEEELPLPRGVGPPLPWSLLPLEEELLLCAVASPTAPTPGSLPRLNRIKMLNCELGIS